MIHQNFFEHINYEGLGIGLATFLIIGLFHPLVIKGEYYLGQKCNWIFLFAGIGLLGASVFSEGTLSILLSVTAFSCFWSILEVREQEKRVSKGWFPANPARNKNKKLKK